MLKQAVGIVASVVAAGIVALSLGVLVRLSWGQRTAPAPEPSSGSDKHFRKA